jgi:hypothetical protein
MQVDADRPVGGAGFGRWGLGVGSWELNGSSQINLTIDAWRAVTDPTIVAAGTPPARSSATIRGEA